MLYTFGYEGFDIDRFIARLKDVGIKTIVDVRQLPLSRKRGFSKAESSKIIEKVLMEEGRPPESIFDFIQGITRLARDKTQQDARLDMESRAKKLLDRVS